MAVNGDLSPRARDTNEFNWLFLGELLVCGVVTLIFLFYFNRGFAKIITIFARIYLWWTGSPHYINIESLQISVLAGRLFFGKVIYHGPNETISIVGGQITWRYWLRRVRNVSSDGTDESEGDAKGKYGGLPCRILVEMKGVEWFIYNRSPQYDWLMGEMAAAAREGDDPDVTPPPPQPHGADDYLNGLDGDEKHDDPKTSSSTSGPKQSSAMPAVESFEDMAANSPYLRMLPIRVDCHRGAVVMGNNNTPSVLVAHFEKAQGYVDARKSRSIDQYKQVFDLKFTHPTVQLKPNANYKESLLARADREQSTAAPNQPTPPIRTRRQKLRDLIPLLTASAESFSPPTGSANALSDHQDNHGQWMGLSRYLDESEHHGGWKFEPQEYASVTDVLDCESATFCLYWDVVGKVPTSSPPPKEGGKERNGEEYSAPEFGIDLSFEGGTIHYGPWADRQRIHLQNMFFPKIYKTAKPAEPLLPGDDRTYTEMKVFVELSSSTILNIPVREASKDWKYRSRLEEGQVRPCGWLEIKAGRMSTLSYNMAYVASSSGWTHTLDLELRTPEVRTSVNHGLLWSAASQTLQCDLSGPLKWNGDTKWVFNNESSGMKVFLLREHITLLTDLATDWTSGPPSEYWTFVPMIYELNLELKDYEFFLNVNDQNIINNPSSFEDNTFVVLRNLGGNNGYLKGCVVMDFREFRPQCSKVEFTVETVSNTDMGGMLEVGVRTPIWNTWNCSLKQQESLGKVGQVKLKGSYEFFANTSPDLIDTLNLNLDGERLHLVLHGFLIRYFLTIKENYFGENLHFKTLEEWQSRQQVEAGEIAPGPTPPASKSNDLDVVLGVRVRELEILLPKHIYDAKEHVKLKTPSLGLDMRFTNYYMDLQVDMAPISAFIGNSTSALPEIFVDGLTIYGHRLFGLPPVEPTYVCNWDLSVGDVAGECSLEFLQTAIFAMGSFVFSFKDIENALPLLSIPIVHDVTFVRLRVGSLRVWLHMDGPIAFRMVADEVSFVLNDLANELHSDRITLKIPGFNVVCMDVERRDVWGTKGCLETEFNVTVLGRKKNASEARRLQQEHVRVSDGRTGRATFLLEQQDEGSIASGPKPASMALPGLPLPFDDNSGSVYDSSSIESDNSSRTTRSSTSKSSHSFLANRHRSNSSGTASLMQSASSRTLSFYSAMESISDPPPPIPPLPRWNPSTTPSATTPGSRDSVRMTPTGMHFHGLSLEMTPKPLEVSLSSPFSRPDFPLDGVEPDLTKVPSLGTNDSSPRLRQPVGHVEIVTDEESSRDSIIVEFGSGIRGYCTPTALREFANLLERIQPQSPEDVLDSVQTNVVSRLSEVVKKPDSHGKVVELYLQLPQFKFCLVDDFVPPSAQEGRKGGHAFNLNLRNLQVTARSRKPALTEEGGKEVTSVHVLLDSLSLDLKDLTPRPLLQMSTQPALEVVVGELLFWASSSEAATVSLQIKNLSSSAQGTQALFIHDVAMRTVKEMEGIAGRFARVSSGKQRRMQQFISALASAGEELMITQDPATLTRPSYVLRSATNHVRLNDSWKITTRLRHIWQSLPAREKDDRTTACVQNEAHPPHSAKARLINVFQRWRGWELGNIKESIMVKQVFGDGESSNSAPGTTANRMLNSKFRIDSVRFLLDPGPTQHEFAIDQLQGLVMAGIPTGGDPALGGDSMAMVAPGVRVNTVVQVHTRSIRLGVRWEFLDILETVANGLQKRRGNSDTQGTVSETPSTIPTSLSSKRRNRSDGFHMIFATDDGSLSLDTVNLRVVSRVQHVQASVVLSEKDVDPQAGKFGNVGNLILRARHGKSEVCHGNKILSEANIRAPSLYGHFDEHWFVETKFHIWKIASSAEEITFDVQEEVLGLMEVFDYLVTDEVAHIQRLMNTLDTIQPQSTGAASPKSPGLSKRKVHMIYGTLSVDQFRMGAKLLPSLTYLVRGGGVQLSAKPNSMDSKEMIVDFGLEHHEHEVFKSVDSSDPRVISLLRLPAINVSIRDRNAEEERLVEATVSIEAITLDASSIQSLLNAIKKPEVVKVIEGVRSEMQAISSKLGATFGRNRKPKTATPTKPSKPLVYQAHAGVSSLKIQTMAPSANLEVNLGFIQLYASNRPTLTGPVLSFPDIRLEFGRITVELTRTAEDGARDTCGFLELHASLTASLQQTEAGNSRPAFYIQSHSLKIDLFAETASAAVDVVGHLQDRLKDLDLSREVKYLRKLRNAKPLIQPSPDPDASSQLGLLNTAVSMEMMGIRVSWIVGGTATTLPSGMPKQNLVLSFKRIHFSTATRKSNEAKLIIEDFILQMVDATAGEAVERSENSALMPEIVFKVAYNLSATERLLAFQAKGRSLDLHLQSSCVLAANSIENSISEAVQKFRDASSSWKSTLTRGGEERTSMFSTKRLASVMVDADFAGAVVHLGRGLDSGIEKNKAPGVQKGRYGQFAQGEANGITMLKSPGLAFKVEYTDPIDEDPSLSAEIKISASDNMLFPSVVPLIIEMSDNVKEIMKQQPTDTSDMAEKMDKAAKDSHNPVASDPAAILGRCRLNIGIRICKQEFTLSCQPIARVAASAGYDQIYATINTCDDPEGGRFYSLSVAINGLKTSLQHVYSRESTGTLEVESVTLSLMDSKHVMGSAGLSCMMKVSPIKSQLNVKQFQDFLLFREIWYPAEMRNTPTMPLESTEDPSAMLVQRYHKVAAKNAFPWNTTVAVTELEVQLDFGQSLGKSALLISRFWITSRKTSDWEQALCLGFDSIRISSTGRLGGYIDLSGIKIRTSINWGSAIESTDTVQTPLIEASVGFTKLEAKVSFDYQAFLLADIATFNFLMYNLQDERTGGERLVGVLDGEQVQIFATTQSAAQGLALYQAFQRLWQEKLASFEVSLKEVESYLNRRQSHAPAMQEKPQPPSRKASTASSAISGVFSLHTDVVVNLKAVHLGAFPSTFYDTSVLKMEALNATAHFEVETVDVKRIHSMLEMKLGELSIALAPVKQDGQGTTLADVSVERVINGIAQAKQKLGTRGIILKVPQVTAKMHTWHSPGSVAVDYRFHSAFEGQVEVGWNFHRVGFIKNMYHTHAKAVAQRQGRPPVSSRISMYTDGPGLASAASSEDGSEKKTKQKGKITAVVDVPQSKYEYNPIDPPIIETPQLRDMGEATPPMEWIGLHRERLPHLTHQIVIVALLEVAREVEDAYSKILGSS